MKTAAECHEGSTAKMERVQRADVDSVSGVGRAKVMIMVMVMGVIKEHEEKWKQ